MTAPSADAVVPAVPIGTKRAARDWLVGPWFDLFFIANIAWPLVVLVQFGDGFAGQAGVEFWQLYFITTPHRWITLAIVFLDGERFQQRRGLFLGLAVGVVLICVGVRLTTGALTCLMAIDYLWNAWHFAAQHHGVYRIYGRLDEPAPTPAVVAEKWTMRGFLLYVIVRVATATWSDSAWGERLQTLDWLAAFVPVGLLLWAIVRMQSNSLGRLVYLVSVLALYSALLWAVHERQLGLMLLLATASALFHAIEYLSLVSWSVQQRHAGLGDRLGLLRHLAPRWGIALAVFVVVLGVGLWFINQRYIETWLFLNIVAAYLHYAYDGLIWRRRA